MEKFNWEEKYSVSVPSIDEQHKNFFRITNDLIDLTKESLLQKKDLVAVAEELERYASYHLKTEEEYFEKFNYENAIPHIKEHDYYRNKVKGIIEKINEGNEDIKIFVDELANFSIQWLSNHILVADKEYSEFFKQHGIH